jgi:hypothetical protein
LSNLLFHLAQPASHPSVKERSRLWRLEAHLHLSGSGQATAWVGQRGGRNSASGCHAEAAHIRPQLQDRSDEQESRADYISNNQKMQSIVSLAVAVAVAVVLPAVGH